MRCEAAPPTPDAAPRGATARLLERGPVLRPLFVFGCVRTDRLLLRRWCPEDAEPFAALNADPEVMRFIGGGRSLARAESDALLERFEGEWDERGFGLWAVEEHAAPGVLLGFCGLTVPSFLPAVLPAVEVGWRLARPAWGRGLATEAARASLSWGWEHLAMREVISIVDPRNERSLRVCAKLGMTRRPDRIHPATRARVRVLGVARPAGA
jgi:RimJ/RimL family protein N-acetyltransferase